MKKKIMKKKIMKKKIKLFVITVTSVLLVFSSLSLPALAEVAHEISISVQETQDTQELQKAQEDQESKDAQGAQDAQESQEKIPEKNRSAALADDPQIGITGGTEGTSGDWETSDNVTYKMHPRADVHLVISQLVESYATVSFQITGSGAGSSISFSDGFLDYAFADLNDNTLIDVQTNQSVTLIFGNRCKFQDDNKAADRPVIHANPQENASQLTLKGAKEGAGLTILGSSEYSALIGGAKGESARNLKVEGLNLTVTGSTTYGALIGGGGNDMSLSQSPQSKGGSLLGADFEGGSVYVNKAPLSSEENSNSYGAEIGGGAGYFGGDAQNMTFSNLSSIFAWSSYRNAWGSAIGGGSGQANGGNLSTCSFTNSFLESVTCATNGAGWGAGIGGGASIYTGSQSGMGVGGSASEITFNDDRDPIVQNRVVSCSFATGKAAGIGGGFGVFQGGDLLGLTVQGNIYLSACSTYDQNNRVTLGAGIGGGGSFTKGGNCSDATIQGRATVWATCKNNSSYAYGADVGGGGTEAEVDASASGGHCKNFSLLGNAQLMTFEGGDHDHSVPAGASVGGGYSVKNPSPEGSVNNIVDGNVFLYAVMNTTSTNPLQGFVKDTGESGFVQGIVGIHNCNTETNLGQVYGNVELTFASNIMRLMELTINAQSSLTVPSGANAVFGAVTSKGSFTVAQGGTATLSGPFRNTSNSMNIEGSLILDKNQQLSNSGAISIARSGTLMVSPDANMKNFTDGNVDVTGTVSVDGSIDNFGTVTESASTAQLLVSGAFHNNVQGSFANFDGGILNEVTSAETICTGTGYIDTQVIFEVEDGPFSRYSSTNSASLLALGGLGNLLGLENLGRFFGLGSLSGQGALGATASKVRTVLYKNATGTHSFADSIHNFPAGPQAPIEKREVFKNWEYKEPGSDQWQDLTLDKMVPVNFHGGSVGLQPVYEPADYVTIDPQEFQNGHFENVPERQLEGQYIYFNCIPDEHYVIDDTPVLMKDGEVVAEAVQDPNNPNDYGVLIPNFDDFPVVVQLVASAHYYDDGGDGQDDKGILPATFDSIAAEKSAFLAPFLASVGALLWGAFSASYLKRRNASS